MFFQKYGIPIKDGYFLLKKFSFFKKEIIEELLKEQKLNNIRKQLIIAEAVRAGMSKPKHYTSWSSKKIREMERLILTEEEKEKKAMSIWKKLIDNKKFFLSKNKIKKRK